jgi:hypothetical protein
VKGREEEGRREKRREEKIIGEAHQRILAALRTVPIVVTSKAN